MPSPVLQVKADLKRVMKKMFPDDQLTAHSQLTNYRNKEGIFGDNVLMGMTEDGNPHQVPTYQFWDQEGEIGIRCLLELHLSILIYLAIRRLLHGS